MEISLPLPLVVAVGGVVGLYITRHSSYNLWFLVPIILGVGWHIYKAVARPRSRLRSPTALGRKVRDGFVGRESQVSSFLELLLEAKAVRLTGESGVGKSRFLDRGLLPTLKESQPTVVPLKISTWGSDWALGITNEVARAMMMTWPHIGPLHNETDPDEILNNLAQISSLSIQPLLIFDQFDDYLNAFRSHFLRGPNGAVLSDDEILAANPFWRALAQVLDTAPVRCIFVVRHDAAWMDLHLHPSQRTYYLHRLPTAVAQQLLIDAASDAFIERPDAGWNDLLMELCRDLEETDGVLPIQMRLAAESLQLLGDNLSPVNYRRRGGLAGLIATNVQGTLASLSRQCGCSESVCRDILLQLARHPKSEAELRVQLAATHQSPRALSELLDGLKQADLIREYSAINVSERMWRLDHDYLAEVVAHIERLENPREYELRQAERRWQRAATLGQAWSALLRPAQLASLWFAAIQGAVRFRPHWRFIVLSSARCLLSVPVLLMLLLSLLVFQRRELTTVQRLFDQIAIGGVGRREEAVALWELTGQAASVRRAVFRKFFDTDVNAARLLNRYGPIMAAVIGTDVRQVDTILLPITDELCGLPRPPANTRMMACSTVLSEWGPPGVASTYLRRALDISTQPTMDALLVVMLYRLSVELDETAATEAFSQIVEALGTSTQADSLLYASLGILARRVGPLRATALSESVTKRFHARRGYNPEDVNAYITLLSALGKRMDPQAVREVGEKRLVELTAAPSSFKELRARELGAFREVVDPSIINAAIAHMKIQYDSENASQNEESRLVDLTEGIVALGGSLNTQEQRRLVEWLEVGLQRRGGMVWYPHLARAFGALGGRADPELRKAVGQRIIDAMNDKDAWTQLEWLGEALAALEGLDETVIEAGARRLVVWLEGERDTLRLAGPAAMLARLKGRLSVRVSDELAERLVGLISKEPEGLRLTALGTGLGGVVETVSVPVAERLIGTLIKLFEDEAPNGRRAVLGESISLFAPRIRDESAVLLMPRMYRRLVNEPWPNCSLIVPFVREQTLGYAVRVLNWPTCGDDSRFEIIKRVGRLRGKRFTSDEGSAADVLMGLADWRGFLSWLQNEAGRLGVDPKEKPSVPELEVGN